MTYRDIANGAKKNSEPLAAWLLRLLIAALLALAISKLSDINEGLKQLDRTLQVVRLDLASNYYTKAEVHSVMRSAVTPLQDEMDRFEQIFDRHIDRSHDERDPRR